MIFFTRNYTVVLVLLLISLFNTQAQTNQICLGDNTTICGTQSVTIQNCNNANNNGLNTVTLDNPTTIPRLTDDRWSAAVNIGFTFNFFGTNYTQCVIGSNGILGFDLSKADTYCAYSMTNGNSFPMTGNTTARNTFMGCYQDINPSITTNAMTPEIQYQTIGTAPNRKFIVLYKNIYFFSCTTVCNYFSMILSEGTNELEVHIGNKPVCSSFNGGLAAQGVQNAAGTTAFMTPGRNISQWTANQDSRKFTPASSTNTNTYTISQIPYTYVTSAGNNLVWFSTQNPNAQYSAYNNGSINVTAASLPNGTTGFYLQGSACGAGLGSVSDTTWITKSSTAITVTNTNDTCSLGMGSATVTPNVPGNYTYAWTPGNYTTQTINNVVAGTYTVTLTDNIGCTTTASTTINSIQPTYTSSMTPVNCSGGTDGTATITPAMNVPGTTYRWIPSGQTTRVATGLPAGNHTCIVSTVGGCVDSIVVNVTTLNPMVITLAGSIDVDCHGKNTGVAAISVANGTAPYTYRWLNSTSTLATANDLVVGDNYVLVRDANNCIDTFTVTLAEPPALQITSISADATICPEDSIYLTGEGIGGSSPYIYEWLELVPPNPVYNPNNNPGLVGSTQTAGFDPVVSGTQYILRLSEQCGSTPAFDTVLVTFFPDVIPSVVSDIYESCQPGTFVFSNNSNLPNDINTMYINFGNGKDTIVGSNFNLPITYTASGYYSIDLIVESINGCQYVNSQPNFIRVVPNPVASFSTNGNPVTIFNTDIQFIDGSSNDVVSWEWEAPGSDLLYSSDRNPRFKYPEGVEGDYPVQLIVTTALGCVDTTTSIIHVINDITFYAPNAFTPDGDEHNNVFKYYIDGIDMTSFNMTIFNRWGEMVWETNDPAYFWDGTYNGTVCQTGTYVFQVRAKDILTDKVVTFNGFVTLLR